MTQIWLNTMILSHITSSSIHILCTVCFATVGQNWLRELTPHCTIKFSLRVKTSKLKTNFFQKSTKIIQDNSYKYMQSKVNLTENLDCRHLEKMLYIFSEYLHLQVAINMNYQSISTTWWTCFLIKSITNIREKTLHKFIFEKWSLKTNIIQAFVWSQRM